MSNPGLVGDQFRNDFCGSRWQSAGYQVETGKNCEETFVRIFSKGTNGLSDTKINPAGLSEMEVFLDSFQIVGNQVTSACKTKSERDGNDVKAQQLDEYLKCTRNFVMGKTQFIYSGSKFSFERIVQHLHDRALLSPQRSHQALNIKDRAKSWPFLERLYGEALKLTSAAEELAPKIEYNVLKWAEKAEVMQPLASYVYVYEVKSDGQVAIRPVPEMVFDPRLIGLDVTSEKLPGGYKRVVRNIFSEIRRQYFENSGVVEFHPEIERRIAVETIAYMKGVAFPNEDPLTFLIHADRNFDPALQLNGDRKTIKGMLWTVKGELAKTRKALGVFNGSFWKLDRIWHQAEIAAYKNGIPITTIINELHTKFSNQLIKKFKDKLDGETEEGRVKILSRYSVETVKPDGTIVFD